jgi:hypothetical protein
MFLLANENGDWLEINKNSKFYLLDTKSPKFKEYAKRNDTEMDSWLGDDKLEYIIEEAGETLAITSLESTRLELGAI